MRLKLTNSQKPIVAATAICTIIAAAIILAGHAGLISPRYAFWARARHIDFKAAQARLDALIPDGSKSDPSQSRIVIHKSKRTLELWSNETLIKTCEIALGGKPEGAKSAQGDGRTPEGEYFICSELDRSRFHLFLGLNYPNADDAQRAFEAGQIDQAMLDDFKSAAANRAQPDWSTPLGGAIGIHGGGTARDWTLGCIAVSNSDIEEIWLAVRIGTPVSIKP